MSDELKYIKGYKLLSSCSESPLNKEIQLNYSFEDKNKDKLVENSKIKRKRKMIYNHSIKKEEKIEKEKKNFGFRSKSKDFKIFFYLLMITNVFILISAKSNNSRLLNQLDEQRIPNITLKVKGKGIKKAFSDIDSFERDFYPKEVYINGELQPLVNYSYYFNLTENNVELIWDNIIIQTDYMFYECYDIIEIDFSNFNTSMVANMSYMFGNCYSLTSINLKNFDITSTIYINSMFENCTSLISLDLSCFDASNVLLMDRMFYNCSSLENLNLTHFKTSKVTDIQYLFTHCLLLRSLDLSEFDTSNCKSFVAMFWNCKSLISLDLSSFNTLSCNDMSQMFSNCISIISLNLSNFNTINVKNMRTMFLNCTLLKSLDLSNFVTSKVTNMYSMFSNCTSLSYLDISNFKTPILTNMHSMFCNCSSLTSLDLSSFNTSNIQHMRSMFAGCSSLTYLDLSNFDTSNALRMHNLFDGCINLEFINLKNFNENNLNIDYAFDIFKNVPNNIVVCINDNLNIILSELNKTKCYSISCSDNWKLVQKTFDNETGICLNKTDSNYDFTEDVYISYNSIKTDSENSIEYSEYSSDLFQDPDTIIYKIINSENIAHTKISTYYQDNSFNSIINQNKTPTKISTSFYSDYSSNLFLNSDEKEYKLINDGNKTQKIISPSAHSKIIYECLLDDTLNNICNFVDASNITEILDIIRNNLLSLYEPENKKSQIIKGDENIIFQLTNSKNELDLLQGNFLDNQNVSILDLGQCEKTIKDYYHLNEKDSLIYLKQENITAKASEKNIQYEIYHPKNFSKLNLSLCEGNTINLYVKMELSQETKEIYENLKSFGYDMLNINDPFYNDICTPYKYANNTDILLSDRINYIYDNKDSSCQSNCQFSSYLQNSLYLNCTCEVVTETNTEESNFSGKKIFESFYDVLKYSNFQILKCYKLIFNKTFFSNNLGSITVIIFFIIYLFCMIIYIIKGIAPLTNNMQNIVFKEEENKIKNNAIYIFNKKKKQNKDIHNKSNKFKSSPPPIKRSISKKILTDKKNNDGSQHIKEIKLKSNEQAKSTNKFKMKKLLSSSEQVINFSKKKDNMSLIKYLKESEEIKEEQEKEKLNSYELNELEYETALLKDKRDYFKIYFDILCREHLIIFTFLICDDYNILYIKYARFIFLVTTDMAMNVFFFSDDSMHKIFLNYGKYNFIQQIPQIIYTTLISQLIEVLLCYLSLTDKYIYRIKNLDKNFEKSAISKILRCIQLKLFYFFFFTFILFGFYWYLVSAFCSVYQNTQITFLKDALFSFLFGILYPFVLYLFPAALRILSFKFKYKCLYKLSDIIPFF